MTEPVIEPASRIRLLREALLWVGAAAGVLCLVLASLGLLLGIKPIVFESGSMSPTISTGDLAISRHVSGSGLHVGDIVTVKNGKGVRVTHRIRSITQNGGGAVTLVLKGDANRINDQNAYQVTGADRVLFSIPKAGYVAGALSGRWGTFAGGLLVGLVLVTAFGRRRGDGEPQVVVETAVEKVVERVEVPPMRRRPVLAAAIGAAMIGLLVVGTKQTGAFWTDAVSIDSGTFTMKATPPPAPRITGCTTANGLSPYNLTWTWAGVDLPANTTFEIRYSNVTPGPTHANQVVTGTSSPTNPHTAGTVSINDEAGDIVIVAITPGGTSANSNTVHYAGKNNSKTCTGTVSP